MTKEEKEAKEAQEAQREAQEKADKAAEKAGKGLASFKIAEGRKAVCGFAHDGKTYGVDKKGVLKAPLALAPHLARHGFVQVAEEEK